MCTILALYRTLPDTPLVVVANRDELYARRSRGPELSQLDDVRFMAGADLESGGTWMGLSESGVFAGLTNIYSPDVRPKSRGEVVTKALTTPDSSAFRAWLSRPEVATDYRPFNLLFGGVAELWWAQVTSAGTEIHPVAPGLHVLPSSGRLDELSLPKVRLAREFLEASEITLETDVDSAVRRLFGVLRGHTQPEPSSLPTRLKGSPFGDVFQSRLQALCVHTEVYGTVSSTAIALSADRTPRYWYSDGHACHGVLQEQAWPASRLAWGQPQ